MMTTTMTMMMMTNTMMTNTTTMISRCLSGRRKPLWPLLLAAGMAALLLLGACAELSPDRSASPAHQEEPIECEPVIRFGFDAEGKVQFVTGCNAEQALAFGEMRSLVGLSLPEAIERLLLQLGASGFVIDDLDVKSNILILELERDDGDEEDDWQEFQRDISKLYQRLELPAITHSIPQADTKDSGVSPSFSLSQARTLASTWIGVSESDLTFAKEELQYRSGELFYELEILADERKYVFRIDAFDGEVLQFMEGPAQH
ncbi:MAG: PepSY domain-containing protein [Bacillota bacterium]|nr:PepSY domain-containing protein [Bacillota bacterium]